MKNKIIFFLLCFLIPTSAGAFSVYEVSGPGLADLVGQEVNQIRVYAANRSGKKVPIPFQIDEKTGNSKGRPWALKPEQANGVLDSDEVLLVAGKDFGKRLGQEQFGGAEKVLELRGAQNSRQYFYVSLENSDTPKSDRRYVQYDPVSDRIQSDYYDIRFSPKSPLIQNFLRIKNGSLPYNVLDRFKARFKLAIKNFFDLSFHEGSIKAKVTGYQAGPIRVIRQVVASKGLGPIKLIPKSKIDFKFYPDWLEVPTKVKNPVNGPKVLHKETTGVSGFDFNQNILGSDFYTNMGTLMLRLDGKLKGDPKRISGKGFRWWSFSGLAGSMVVGVQNDSKLKRMGIHPILVVISDMERSNPPESQKGEVFIGFDLPYHRIPKGNYAIHVTQVFPGKFQPGQEDGYLQGAKLRKIQGVAVLK